MRTFTASERFFLTGIVGPSGSGKSALALHLARRFDGEVVSCDALHVYRGLEIGTGKLPEPMRSEVPHHLLDLCDPDRSFSAAEYARRAAPVIQDIDRRGRLPLVAGGSGLYLRALLGGLFEGPGREPGLRARLEAIAARRGSRFLHRLLGRLDPRSAARLHPNDTVRLIRALEVTLVACRPMSDLLAERRSPLAGYRALLLGLAPGRSELARRIDARVEAMFKQGLVEEVRRLVAGFGAEAPALKAIGYREVIRHLSGDIELEEAKRLTVKATLRYAKRQMTWFRREPVEVWFTGGGEDPAVAEAASTYLQAALVALQSVGEESLHAKTAP